MSNGLHKEKEQAMNISDCVKSILEGAEASFFEAMMDGYAGGKEVSTKTKDSDGYKTITWEKGDYKVVDRYCITPLSDFSAGTTTIFYRHEGQWIPVWWMSYSGRYPKELIAFLKECLIKNYTQGIFLGGRGPAYVKVEPEGRVMQYSNDASGNFSWFQGEESIKSQSYSLYGYHKYFGMALV
jgi:hypothetical protein